MVYLKAKYLFYFCIFFLFINCEDNDDHGCHNVYLSDFEYKLKGCDSIHPRVFYSEKHIEANFYKKDSSVYLKVIIYFDEDRYENAYGILKESGDTILLSYDFRNKSWISNKLFGPQFRSGLYRIYYTICGIKKNKDYIIKFKKLGIEDSSAFSIFKISKEKLNEIFDSLKIN